MRTCEAVAWFIGWSCQIAVIVFEVIWCYRWWGYDGLVIGILGGPVIGFLFPFLYWFKEGFSWFYFGLWVIGLTALTYAQVLKRLRELSVSR